MYYKMDIFFLDNMITNAESSENSLNLLLVSKL